MNLRTTSKDIMKTCSIKTIMERWPTGK